MGSPGSDFRPLSGKIIRLIGIFKKSPSRKDLQKIIESLGGQNWRRRDNLPPTDLILACHRTVKQQREIKTENDRLRKEGSGDKIHTPGWLADIWNTKIGKKHNVESLSCTGPRGSSIEIPSRHIVSVIPPPADTRIKRAKEGPKGACFLAVDHALGATNPNTVSSSSQYKFTEVIIEPMRAPADAQNRVLERPRVLCTDKTSIPPPERAGEVDVKFIPDVSLSLYHSISDSITDATRKKDHDEDDGSYKVTPNTKLTEQCQFSSASSIYLNIF